MQCIAHRSLHQSNQNCVVNVEHNWAAKGSSGNTDTDGHQKNAGTSRTVYDLNF